MNKITIELTETELKLIVNALKYTKAYKGVQAYQVVLENIVNRLTAGIPKYYVVQGILDDGIIKYPKNIIVKAKNAKHAYRIAKAHLESEAGEVFTITKIGEATKDYALCEVL